MSARTGHRFLSSGYRCSPPAWRARHIWRRNGRLHVGAVGQVEGSRRAETFRRLVFALRSCAPERPARLYTRPGSSSPNHRDSACQNRHHRQADGQRAPGFPDVPGEHIQGLPGGIASPVVENPRPVRPLMVGRPAVDPMCQVHGGGARVVERDADDLVQASGIVGRGPIHRAATDGRTRGFL